MAFEMHLVSTHLSPAKDRSLATALLRMSERKSLHDDYIVEKVMYCGAEEPFKGWTNTAPTASFSDSNRPKPVGPGTKKKKLNKKMKPLQNVDSLGDLYVELIGVASKADGHYHASATIQELYDEYKKRHMIESSSKFAAMIDPITFRYVPLEERTEDSFDGESGVKLPVLKMTHADQQSKLLKVLESFMQRKYEQNRKEFYDVNGQDAVSFYDKYREFFKNKQHHLMGNTNTGRIEKNRKRKRGTVGGSYKSSTDSEKSSTKIRQRSKSYPPTYVIRVKDEKNTKENEKMITFERKTDYGISAPGGPGIDRWVARVVIKSNDNYNDDQDTSTTTSGSQLTEKSSQSSTEKRLMSRIKQLPPTNVTAVVSNGDYRLSNKRNHRRRNRRLPADIFNLYKLSSVETAKVSVKYDVEVEKRKGRVREPSDETDMESNGPSVASHKRSNGKVVNSKPTLVHSQQHVVPGNKLKLGTQHVISLSKRGENAEQTSKNVLTTIHDESEEEQNNQDGRTKNKGGKSNKILKPLKGKRAEELIGGTGRKKTRRVDPGSKAKSSGDKLLHPVPHSGESSDERQVKSPSSSTFDPDRLFQQMRETAEFITKAPMLSKNIKSDQASPKFLTRIDDARTSESHSTSSSDPMMRKPLHPRHGKNPAQDELQRMIDEEKLFVSEAIKQINSNWDYSKRDQLPPVSENIQDALSTAIAKARLSDFHVYPGMGKGMTQVMRRRVVPPIKEKSPMTTTVVGMEDNFFISDTTKFSSPRTKGGNPKNKLDVKKTNSNKFTITNEVRSLSNDRNAVARQYKLQPRVQMDNMIISKPRIRVPLIPGTFEASISSIKPERRIANVSHRHEIKQRM